MTKIRIEQGGVEKFTYTFAPDDVSVQVNGAKVYPHGWIKLSERKPTQADGDNNGYVVLWDKSGWSGSHKYDSNHMLDQSTHWHPLPKLIEKDENEEAFSKWFEPYYSIAGLDINKMDACRKLAQMAWEEALKTRK